MAELKLLEDWYATGNKFWVSGSDIIIEEQIDKTKVVLDGEELQKTALEDQISTTKNAMISTTVQYIAGQLKTAGDIIIQLGLIDAGISAKDFKKLHLDVSDLKEVQELYSLLVDDVGKLLDHLGDPNTDPARLVNDFEKIITPIGKELGKVSDSLSVVSSLKTGVFDLVFEFKEYRETMEKYWQSLSATETKLQGVNDKINVLQGVIADAEGYLAKHESNLSITGGDTAALIGESMLPPSGNLSGTGTLQFSDANFRDTHTAAVQAPPDALGTLLPKVTSESFGSTGTVFWSYAVPAASVEYLALGQERQEQFLLTITDSSGTTASTPITVTIRGTNDAPVLEASGDVTGAISSSALTDGGSFAYTDVDLSDSHQVSWAFQGQGAPLGTFQITPHDSTGTGSGSVDWAYTANPSAIAGLTSTTTESYAVTVSDGQGGQATQIISITIGGSSDGTGGGGDEPPPPQIPPGQIVTMDIFTDPVLHDFNGDGAVETPIYVHNAEYYTFDVTNAFSGQYQWAYGGPTDDYDLIVYGPTETFEGFSFPAWEIEAYLENPDFGATRLQTATDAYSIANQDSDAPVRGAFYGPFDVSYYEYSVANGNVVGGISHTDHLDLYTDDISGFGFPYDGPWVHLDIPGSLSGFSYHAWILNVEDNFANPNFEVPAGGNTIPNAGDVIAML